MPGEHRRNRSNALRAVLFSMAAAAVAAGVLLTLAFAPAVAQQQHQTTIVAGICLVVLIGAFWLSFHFIRSWQRDLQRLRGALLLAQDGTDGFAGHARRLVESADMVLLAETLDHVLGRERDRHMLAEERLAAVLAGMPAAVIVVTESGLVGLVDGSARQIFPSESIAPGTSIFAALRRDSLETALQSVAQHAGAVSASLTTTDDRILPVTIARMASHGGFVLVFDDAGRACSPGEVEHDLDLLDRLPQAAPADAATPLEELPLLVFDSETTGLDPAKDRVVSMGAVLAHGGRVFVHENLDMLVKPDIPIPARSTAIHGIDDAMVIGAEGIANGLGRLAQMVAGRVMLGHNIGFDLAVLGAEADRTGTAWIAPPALDTSQLVAALEPDMDQLDLDRVAEHFGVAVTGRHTALGDALVAADLFARLIPLLTDRGVRTLGEAWAFSRRGRGLRAQQVRAGWHAVGE